MASPKGIAARLHTIQTVRASQVDEAIVVEGKSPNGSPIRFTLKSGTATALIDALRCACSTGHDRMAQDSPRASQKAETQIVSRAAVEYTVGGAIRLHFDCDRGRHEFEISAPQAATLSLDLTSGRPIPAPIQYSPDSAEDTLPPGDLPSVLELPLVTEPIRTSSMTDFPDGLAIEMRMDAQLGDAFTQVRVPMFADAARSLIGAHQQRLVAMGQTKGPLLRRRSS